MSVKKKILLSPLIIAIIIIILGVGAAGAAIFIGTTQQGETNSQSINLQKGLVGNWDFNGNAKDKTMYANNGTVTGATLTTDRKGQTNKAYYFDGNDYVDVGNPSSLAFGTGAFSISLWVNTGSATDLLPGIIEKGNGDWSSGGGQSGWFLGSISGASTWAFALPNGAGGATRLDFGSLSGRWRHLVVVGDDASNPSPKVTLFVNNVQVDQDTRANVSLTTSYALNIGRWRAYSRYFQGSIDDVRIYNRALTAAEISSLYESYNPSVQISDLQKGLVGNWDFNGNAKDKTMYANNGTVTGATLTTDRKGQVSKAYSFSGTDSQISFGDIFDGTFSSDFTVSFWMKIPAVQTDWIRYLIFKKTGSVGVPAFAIGITGSSNASNQGKIEIRHNSDVVLGYSNNTYADNAWHSVVVVRNDSGNAVNIYVDGASENTLGDITFASGDGFFIGSTDNLTREIVGTVDDVRIYNRALTSAEISSLYESYNPSVQISDLQKGLVGNWDFNGNAKDKTMYANNGTVTGATLTTDRKGQTNKAYSFDGSTNYIDLPKFSFNQVISISAWVNVSNVSGNKTIFGARRSTSSGDELWLYVANNLISWSGINSSAGIAWAFSTTNTVSASTWTHIVATSDGSNAYVYINGVQDVTSSAVTGTITSSGNPSTSWYIGKAQYDPSNNRWMNGSIDDVRIYNRALSATEVTALYNSY